MIEDYRVSHELFLLSFSRLMEAARRTNESVKKTGRSGTAIRLMQKKRPLIVAIEKSKEGSNCKKEIHKIIVKMKL